MNEKAGIGVIGTGFARRVQIPAFLECGAPVVSVASGHLSNAEETAREFDIKHFTDDWRETVAHPDVRLVCITTPPVSHFEMTRAALEAGKHVLCEKPMAMTTAEAAAMTALAKEKNVLALIDHELRFLPGRRRAFELLRAGAIGRVRHVKANFRAPHRGGPDAPWNWWSDKTAGGGTLGAIVSHLLDSLFWFLDTEIDEVYCRLQTHVKERKDAGGALRPVTTDDEANLILKFAAGEWTADATGVVSASMAEYPKYQNRLELFGTDGALRIEARGELFLARAGENDWTKIDTDLGRNVEGVGDTGFARGFMSFAPAIVDALLDGRTAIEHAATFEDGLRVQKVLDAARASDAGSRVLSLES
ncbi:MAG: Gfo/Idh/MocA family oxidoreductase [Acidobacteria bacterium]|nr:Gfo/Idh/MocA family oxidoreductase [Acidobacteriota bacterium]